MSESSNAPKRIREIPISILDLAPIVVGSTAAKSFKNTLDLARHAEKWGYHRYWLAEHHNMTGIASSATSLVIGHVAAGTEKIRVGSGGIMLPNHAPLVIAEQFGTLESLFPGRIDLGLGRAPGSDQPAARALRRGLGSDGHDFPEQLSELRAYLNPSMGSRPMGVRAVPGEGLNIPIWLLGSSGFSAQLAGQLGLPFAFASHFAPDYILQALELYRSNFRPSEALDKPYAMIGMNVIAADTVEEAKKLATSQEQQFLNLIRGRPGQLNPPVDSMDSLWGAHEKAMVQKQLSFTVAGNQEMLREQLEVYLEQTQADELIVTAQIYDHQARLRSYEILAEVMNGK
ncbi:MULTISPECIES: LLM class flavin-dependent oxidoreductase [unclassified Paenibacillus]|uniref:LLM class flavin-dependent oxidoreductase n=1 Tax=unclassified Paenibacillus TaxID=185978 RepID=UPI001AE81C31|nr:MULTISPECIES: LLM class flavin-dependent oxidoreductase [unclassified Paenibacillus]MBP1153316.1 luciferase family oxidoreductase group 1 [Paenibacillus sp. PvP091]MBP1171301.1 luciferase family oxidoreductase group 1 [Paenibacillus sp. PvR098]MBP2442329.1 luciferase family oxidoreductase group 1 [Paenibacillus sp. PvP052]